jgi:hypothetical protein
LTIRFIGVRVVKSDHQFFIKGSDKHVIREKDHVFIVCLSRVVIWLVGEGIRCSEFGSCNMMEFDIIAG